jgi:hypothetical protein
MAQQRQEFPLTAFAAACALAAAAMFLTHGGATTGKLRVLIVEESAARASLPAAQVEILAAKEIRDYAKGHCLEEDGLPAFRVFDKDDDLGKLPAAWREIAKRPHKSLPWITVAVGGTYYDGPLPADIPATLALLKKYGGK